jgi:hypothetical protein
MGKQQGYVATGNKVILVVGEPFNLQQLNPDPDDDELYDQGDYPTPTGSEAYAHGWYQYSSREYKKDIVPMAPSEYGPLLSRFMATRVVSYHYIPEQPDVKPHLGFIAEDAPEEMVDEARKSISLGEEASFLLAAAKAVRAEQDDVRRRIEELKRK